ncbi:MAG: hypothetical protein GX323_08680 [Clostridiales bacterium]|nr:hypothetical protein [Clostridiales bacterium]
MNEINLIDMLSYLDIDLLENDNIESDLSKAGTVFKIIIYIFASMAIIASLLGILLKKKKKIKPRKLTHKFPKKVLKLVASL